MADEKWITGLQSDMPVSAAAQLVLPLRLGVVRDRLPAAALRADEDVEHVHQLRVGTRRAAAALRIFAGCLPEGLHDRTRRALGALRRAAGQARDWDVFLDMLRARLPKTRGKERRGLDFLLGFAHGQRALAQEQLREAYAARADKFTKRIAEVQEALNSAAAPGIALRAAAVPMLTTLLNELISTARGDVQQYDVLHQVRILGKQLRYAMEIFAVCFAPEFRECYYLAIVEMQDILGLANDSHVACQRLLALRQHLMRTQSKQWPHYRAGLEMLLSFHERRLPTQRKKFQRWWRAWLRTGAEQAFAGLIHGA